MNKVLDAPLEQNLKPLSIFWWHQQLPHHIVERAGRQIVLVEQPQLCEQMREDYAAFIDGSLNIEWSEQIKPAPVELVRNLLRRYPVTLSLVVLSLLGFALVSLQLQSIVDWLVIQSVDTSGLAQRLNLPEQISINEFLSHGQYWRLITPIFLHFGWVHITFNMLWLWELGRRIEVQGGSLHLLCVVLFVGAASNLYQAASTPFAFFGGMSGVIYGLLGYSALFNFISPHKNLVQPKEVYIIMLASLLIGWLGVFDFLAQMANTAHLSGLLCGALIAIPSALISRYSRPSN